MATDDATTDDASSHASARRVQCAWRRKRAAKHFLGLLAAAQQQQREDHAARLVQGLFWRAKSKRKIAELIAALQEQKAAAKLQRNARNYISRQQSRLQSPQPDVEMLHLQPTTSKDYSIADDLTGTYQILNGTDAKLVQDGCSIVVTVLPPASAVWSPATGVVEEGGGVSLQFGTFGHDVAMLQTSRFPHVLRWADGSSWVQISTDIHGYTPRPPMQVRPHRKQASVSFLKSPTLAQMFQKRMGF